MTSGKMALSDLNIGDYATVTGYSCGACVLKERLLAMGLTRGTDLQVMRQAPSGDPIEVRTRGFSLSIRRAEAAHLQVAVGTSSITAVRDQTPEGCCTRRG